MLGNLQKTWICAGVVLATALPALAARTYVRGYYRKDGTYVRGHYRGGTMVGASDSGTGTRSPSLTNSGVFEVKGYFRRDGTFVRAHVRTQTDGADYKALDFRQLKLDRDGKIGPGSELRNLVLPKLDLSRANFAGVDLKGSAFEGGQLRQANLTGAILTEMKLRGADLRGAILDDADLIRAELEAADLTGAQAQAARFDGARLVKANFHDADLSDASLVGADLAFANLENAKLAHGRLSLANLAEANLTGADLRGADLSSAKLAQARLTGALYSESTEWPDGFNPAGAGAILKEEAAPRVPEAGVGSQLLLSQITAAVAAGDLAGAERLTAQLSELLREARARTPAAPQQMPDDPVDEPAEEPAAEGQRVARALQTSPGSLELAGGIKGQLFFPAAPAYVMYGAGGTLRGNVSSQVTVRVSGGVVTGNRIIKLGERALRVRYVSTNPEVVAIDAQGQISVRGPGQAEIAVRVGNGEWRFPIKVVRLDIWDDMFPHEVQTRLGFPDTSAGGLWIWKKYPGLKLRIGANHRIESNWDEHPGIEDE